MLTECPSCLTVFRVTGAILKMGHGQVRCGKCRTQFDALDSLLDDSDEAPAKAAAIPETAAPSEDATAQPIVESGIEAREPEIAEEITLEGSRIEISGTYRVSDANLHGESDEPSEHIVHEHLVFDRDEPHIGDGIDSVVDVVESDEPIEEQIIEVGVDDGESVGDAAHHLLADTITPASDEPLPLAQRIWKRSRSQKDPRDAEHRQIAAELDELTLAPPPPKERAGMWTAASLVLVVALLAQVVNHYRDSLVRNVKWGSTVASTYRMLGLSLTPNWDLRAYKLQVWEVKLSGAKNDELRLRGNVTNTAAFGQPYPFIKLTMLDQWQTPVARRTFTPEDYLSSAATANRMMTPKQPVNTDIAIVDPGADAVGYAVYACLPHNGGFVCQDELPEQPTAQ